MQAQFHTGVLFGLRTDVSNPTPVEFGALQEVSIEFAANNKELMGQNTYPLAVASGVTKVTGKAKFGRFQGRVYNDLFFGETMNTGQKITSWHEAGTIPTTPYQITVANSATWVEDLGVYFAATGIPLTRVASGPATGQYSVAAGVYTFAAADTTLAVVLSYTYTTTGGQKFAITNKLIGTRPTFKIVLYNNTQIAGTPFKWQGELNACMANKISFPAKMEDWMLSEIDFSAYADASGNVGALSFAELS